METNKHTIPFSRNTNDYLDAYACILKEMICGMTTARLSDSISHNFIVQMIPHHRAAIQMSRNVLKYTTNCDIERIASNIITEQTKSIDNMEKALPCCAGKTNSKNDLCSCQKQVEEIFQTMFHRMQTAKSCNSIDCNFLWEMLPHHEGAVAFSETTLEYCICPELKPILQAIISSQKQGIRQMKELLRGLSC
ncbi:MAG: DUF305 domain-containing protein [Blautia sp.]|nr:DUF305 domain-containing protein [Blautia sp.]MCM1201032.1 DUF305 domain-containing protein [Bacteroides fragilis]